MISPFCFNCSQKRIQLSVVKPIREWPNHSVVSINEDPFTQEARLNGVETGGAGFRAGGIPSLDHLASDRLFLHLRLTRGPLFPRAVQMSRK